MGGLDHRGWRQEGKPFITRELEYCVDGDLIELFLELSEEGQKAVVSVVNEELKRSDSVKWMINYIQSIKTKHSTLC